MSIYTEEFKIKTGTYESATYNFKYTFNNNTLFQELLEFIALLIPNICIMCHKFYLYKDKYKKFEISNEDRISKYKKSDFQQLYLFCNKCWCDKEFKNNIQKTKLYLCKKNKELEEEISDLKKENKNLKELREENTKLNNEINDLKKEKKEIYDLLKRVGENETGIINQLIAIGQRRSDSIFNNNRYKMNNTQIKGKEGYLEVDFKKFYDVIIDIKSIKDINKGWVIKKSKRISENYKEIKNSKIIKIGVIGNSNKGKSFILSKISKIELPSGTSIRTEGLSIKYPELGNLYKYRKIALLDSAGLETPVLKEEEEEYESKDTSQKEEYNTIDKEELEDTQNESMEDYSSYNVNKVEVKKNKDDNEKKKENEKKKDYEKNRKEIFKEKSREKIITELFLQNYIIFNSDILIVVVGILSFSEQKLLNRIRTEIKRNKINRPLYIIHNLKTYTSIKQVQDYINNTLLRSATFDLEEQEKISTKTEEKDGINFYEKKSQPPIFHLIFANEGSEAGKYYNKFTLDYIEHTYQNVKDLSSFDVISTVKNSFKEISKNIIINQGKNIIFDNSDPDVIKLKEPENIVLKKCLIDELGFSNLKANGFEPNYNYYIKDNKKLIVRVEAPGNCNIKSNIDYNGDLTLIKLSGEKQKDMEPKEIEDNSFNSREFGDFSLEIFLKTEELLIKNEKPDYLKKNGLYILSYNLDEKKDFEAFEQSSTDMV